VKFISTDLLSEASYEEWPLPDIAGKWPHTTFLLRYF
jgi:hypothetical protein